MRKALYLLIIPVLLIGCSKVKEAEVPQEQEGLHEVVFHAGWDPETRTMLQEDGSVWWEPGDSICIFAVRENSSSFFKFISTNTTDASKTDFVGTVDERFDNAKAYYALYPYRFDLNGYSNLVSDTDIGFVIPTVQTAVEGSFDPRAFVSFAVPDENNNLYFKNLCGGVKFSVSQEGIKEVSFRYFNDESMSGFIVLDHEDGEIIPRVNRYQNEVIVRAPGNSYFEVGKNYYAVMCPTVEEDSPLIVTYKKDHAKAVYMTEGPGKIKRSVFTRLLNKDEGLTFVPCKDEAVMMKNLPDHVKWISDDSENRVITITEVYFHPSSDKVTDDNLGTEDAPVYFEIDGTIAHYYTPKESFNIKNVSRGLFHGWRSLTKVDLTGVDAYEATDFSYCFADTKLKSIDLSHFDISNATNMEYMFGECKSLESLDLSSFNPDHVMKMTSMFYLCRSLRELNLSSFDTKRCLDMSWMFCYCVSLQKLDLSSLDVSSVRMTGAMCHNIAIHRKLCFIKASDATKDMLCGLDAGMPQAARDYYITWLAPGEAFPEVIDAFPDLYKSTDYSKDMTYSLIQSASKDNGIDLVILGDAYSDRLINDGTYDRDLTNVIDHIFMEEPLNSLRDYFNIYITYAVSENETNTGITALDLVFEDGSTRISGGDGIVDDYMRATLPDYGFGAVPFIIILANTHRHAGCCEFYSSGSTLVYTTLGIDEADFHATQCHEFGHAIGKLADEYDEWGWTYADTQGFIQSSSEGWWPNVDITSDLNSVKWSRFLQDERYANQGLGLFEGGFASYAYGIWRPTENSIMNTAATGFNAPSRQAIYKQVHELAEDSFVYDYETFVAFDQKARAAASNANRAPGITSECILPHLPPPVFIHNPNGSLTTLHQ